MGTSRGIAVYAGHRRGRTRAWSLGTLNEDRAERATATDCPGALTTGAVALAALITLQTVVFGLVSPGVLAIDPGAAGWVRRAEIDPSMVGPNVPGEWSWPVAGRITTNYGGCTFAMCPHWGIDIAAPPGTPVRAAADGIVIDIGWDPDGYGHYVILTHRGGIQTLYAHLRESASDRPGLEPGDMVTRGEMIGLLGSTGASSGPHVHFELRRDGRFVDSGLHLDR